MAVLSGDVFNFALRQVLFGQEVINTFAFRVIGAPVVADDVGYLAYLFEDATGWFNLTDNLRSEIAQNQTTQVTHTNWFVQRVNQNPTALYTFPIVTGAAGVLTGDCETANVTMSIERKGGGPGKRQRGRIALSGSPTDGMAAGLFSNNRLAEAAGIAAQMRGVQILAPDWGSIEMGFWSPYHVDESKDPPKVYEAQFVACLTAQCRQTVRVQRSRTVGKGS